MHSSPLHCSAFSAKKRGSSFVLALVVLLLSSLLLGAVSRSVAFQLQRAKAFRDGRSVFERWEQRSVSSTERLELSQELVVIPPPKELSSLRAPLFKTSTTGVYRWPLKWQEPAACSQTLATVLPLLTPSYFETSTCRELPNGSEHLLRGNLAIDQLRVTDRLFLAVTGQVKIEELVLTDRATIEIVAGGTLRISNLLLETNAELTLHSITGEVELPNLPCSPTIRITIPGKTSGCHLTTPLSQDRFKKSLFLGEIEQGALVEGLSLE